MSEQALIAQIEKLQAEIKQLKGQTVFADIQPYLEENESKFKKLIISGIGLQYLVRVGKKDMVRLLQERVANDLMQDVENVQLLHPVKGTVLKGDEDFAQFEEDGVFRLDFQYASQCGHGHDHDHEDDDDEFSDDDNFYNNCSCSHQH